MERCSKAQSLIKQFGNLQVRVSSADAPSGGNVCRFVREQARANQRSNWSAERIETAEAIGIRMLQGGKQTTVSIPKANTSGMVHVE